MLQGCKEICFDKLLVDIFLPLSLKKCESTLFMLISPVCSRMLGRDRWADSFSDLPRATMS